MLREAWRIARALEAAGIATEARTADVTSPGKTGGPAVRVLLGADSSAEIMPIADAELESLWSFRKANFHYWPVVRPSRPLCDDEEHAASWRDRLANAKAEGNKAARGLAVTNVLADGFGHCDISLAPLRADESRARGAHAEKFGPTSKLPRQLRILRWRIHRYMRQPNPTIQNAPQSAYEAVFSLVYGREVNGKIKGGGQIAFDLKEETIYTPELRATVEAALSRQVDDSGPLVTCSLSGLPGILHQGKFPNPSLPIVTASGIAMFSMFSEAETNYRYGRSDDKIVTISTRTVQSAQDAISFATEKTKRGQSWAAFPNGRTKDRRELKDLLIAYATGVRIAPLASGLGGDEDELGVAYEDAISSVIEALDGVERLTPKSHVVLILLRQISNAQVQSVYCRTPLASEVLRAGRRWIAAQRLRPRLMCAPRRPRPISPSRVVQLLSKQWVDSPPRPSRLAGPSGGDILDFMLADGHARTGYADDLLRMWLARSDRLVAHVASELRRNMRLGNPADSDDDELPAILPALVAESDRLCSLISLVFDAKEMTMEETSRSPAYLLGLLLGVVDTLHWAYCKDVRKDIPPSLGGSQLLGIAADDPAGALTDLLERIRPWYNWADTASPNAEIPKESDLTQLRAKKALGRLSAVAPHLAGRLPDQLDNVGKAELLLGFMSRDDVADQYRSQ